MSEPAPPRRFQFSLRAMMIACVAAGALVGAHIWAWHPAALDLPLRRVVVTLAIFCDVILAVGLGLVVTLALVELTMTRRERELLNPHARNEDLDR